jgi:hypothetical protein
MMLVLGLVVTEVDAGGRHSRFAFQFGRPLKVMTRNLYIGTDLFKVLEPCKSEDLSSGLPEQLCLPFKVAAAFQTIPATDFVTRAEAIADEIERYRPDLIGLQEVYLIRLQSPGNFIEGVFRPDAADVAYDYLEILLGALWKRGLQYEAVATIKNVDLEFPMLAGFNGLQPLLDDVRITDRDVILVRKHAKILEVDSRTYQNLFVFDFEMPGGAHLFLPFKRGFCSVKARVRGATYRFVNTHLEVRDFWVPVPGSEELRAVQRLQVEELMTELAGETLPTVLVGDFNSDPNDPEDYAYSVMGASGFVDVWHRRWWRPDPGLTCCREQWLADPGYELYERIDLVFVRNDFGVLDFSLIGPVYAQVVGADPIADAPPLYASDHAGVFARLKLPLLRWHRRDRP